MNFFAFPSLKRVRYYIEDDNKLIRYFFRNIHSSNKKILNAMIYLQRLMFFFTPFKVRVFLEKDEKFPSYLKNAIKKINCKMFNNKSSKFIIRLSTWHRKDDKFIIYIFDDRKKQPIAIAKCLSREHSFDLEKEFNNMSKISKYFDKSRLQIASPLSIIKDNTQIIYVEKFCEGYTLNNLADRTLLESKRLRLYYKGLAIVYEIVMNFAKDKTRMKTRTFEHYLKGPVENFEKTKGLAYQYPQKVKILKGKLKKVANKSIFSMPMHGDLWGGSILINNNVNIIDWEFFQEEGIPLWDIFMFAVHPGFVFKKSNKGLLSEFCSFYTNKNVIKKLSTYLFEFQQLFHFDFNDIELLFQCFFIYNILTRDNIYENTWEKCLRYYWTHSALWTKD